MFLKILHYALFGSSTAVKKYIFNAGVDPDTIHLNDYKFFKAVIFILVNLFTYKVKITIDQFFKYGFAEQKMLLCCDVIELVKQKHKHIGIQRSLSAKRSATTREAREAQAGRFSVVALDQGK